MDHTVLKPTAVAEDIIALCEEAKEMKFKAVCVHACHVAFCKERLAGTEVSVACVCDFPHGQSTPAMKRRQAEDILSLGADEIDVVLNVGLLKDQNYPGVFSDVGEIATAVSAAGKCLKVILETCLLTPQEIIDACIICVACGVGFVKTSTGFSTGGATREAVVIMLTVVGPNCLVKASGGIRDRHTTQEYLRLGVKRIGTSSGVTICK
ncbi:deoxyribose-phosphate aldolase [Angomonas deanei]|nr:deoxyribose-phosphate aldolase [Angomonas deanei]EPY40731.1 deoxyribose-phosphate aldolase [Angomonas deanei]|eukprot:EPY29733.1 deoxyribose-phosphate aldolase [Angomonas deanei]